MLPAGSATGGSVRTNRPIVYGCKLMSSARDLRYGRQNIVIQILVSIFFQPKPCTCQSAGCETFQIFV